MFDVMLSIAPEISGDSCIDLSMTYTNVRIKRDDQVILLSADEVNRMFNAIQSVNQLKTFTERDDE